MPTSAAIPVEEYLSTSYHPDREYVDGMVLERNLGERTHARLQALVLGYALRHEKKWRVVALPEQRVQVRVNRFRVPDDCLIPVEDPDEPVVRHPPIVCIEILSREDRMAAMHDKINDYLDMGVSHVWFLDPVAKRAFDFTKEGMREVSAGSLRIEGTEIELPIEELFQRLHKK